jgi:hypothetical protein
MFYEETEIKSLLICPICQNVYKDPRVLPCGSSACNQCIKDCFKTINNQIEVECYICFKNHQIPINGFASNSTILSLKAKKPIEASVSDEDEASLSEKLLLIKKKNDLLTRNIEVRLDQILKNAALIRDQVQLQTDALSEQIHNLNQKFLNELY